MVIKFQELDLDLKKDLNHDYVMSSELVAKAYGVTNAALRNHKMRHDDELIEGKHYILGDKLSTPLKNSLTKCDTLGKNQQPHEILWTKRGVVKLGFFLRSERAKQFRNFAEDLVLNTEKSSFSRTKALEMAEQLVKENEALKAEFESFKNQIAQEGVLIEPENTNMFDITEYTTVSQWLEKHDINLKMYKIITISELAKKHSRKDSYPVLFKPSKEYKKVNLYHSDMIQRAYFDLFEKFVD